VNKKVYLSLLQKNNNDVKILGVYSTEEKAINRCLKEPCFSHQGWRKESIEKNHWHNGYGLYTKVLESAIE